MLTAYRNCDGLPLVTTTVMRQELCDLEVPSDPSLPVPDERGVLRPVSALVFNDAPWLDDAQSDATFVHPRLSHEVAAHVGVASLRR